MLSLRTKTILLIAFILLLAVPAMAAVPPGRITVYSSPSAAHACIDNKDCDTTPSTFAVEGNAWHMVVVKETGYRDWTEVIYVTSDQTSVASAYLDLDPATTTVRVNVTPGGGTICLDNVQCHENVGTVNSTGSTQFMGVNPGYHTISVESPAGYTDTQKLIQVNLGKTTDVYITLAAFVTQPTTSPTAAPATGMVRVYVDRTGSTICIDNTRCEYNVGGRPGPGTGTVIFDNVLATETHIITVAADGYKPVSATVSVGKDMIGNVDVSLKPIAGATTVPTTMPTTVTTVPLTTATPPPTMPSPRAGLDVIPVLGALALCGVVVLSRNGRS